MTAEPPALADQFEWNRLEQERLVRESLRRRAQQQHQHHQNGSGGSSAPSASVGPHGFFHPRSASHHHHSSPSLSIHPNGSGSSPGGLGLAIGDDGEQARGDEEFGAGAKGKGKERAREDAKGKGKKEKEESVELKVVPLSDSVHMFGSSYTSANYSLSGLVVLSVPTCNPFPLSSSRPFQPHHHPSSPPNASLTRAIDQLGGDPTSSPSFPRPPTQRPPHLAGIASNAHSRSHSIPISPSGTTFSASGAGNEDLEAVDDDVAEQRPAQGNYSSSYPRHSTSSSFPFRFGHGHGPTVNEHGKLVRRPPPLQASPRLASPTRRAEPAKSIHISSLLVIFTGYAHYVDHSGRFGALRLCRVQQELLPNGGSSLPEPTSGVDGASAEKELLADLTSISSDGEIGVGFGRARKWKTKYEIMFDLSLPGWLPPSVTTRFGGVFYTLEAIAKVEHHPVRGEPSSSDEPDEWLVVDNQTLGIPASASAGPSSSFDIARQSSDRLTPPVGGLVRTRSAEAVPSMMDHHGVHHRGSPSISGRQARTETSYDGQRDPPPSPAPFEQFHGSQRSRRSASGRGPTISTVSVATGPGTAAAHAKASGRKEHKTWLARSAAKLKEKSRAFEAGTSGADRPGSPLQRTAAAFWLDDFGLPPSPTASSSRRMRESREVPDHSVGGEGGESPSLKSPGGKRKGKQKDGPDVVTDRVEIIVKRSREVVPVPLSRLARPDEVGSADRDRTSSEGSDDEEEAQLGNGRPTAADPLGDGPRPEEAPRDPKAVALTTSQPAVNRRGRMSARNRRRILPTRHFLHRPLLRFAHVPPPKSKLAPVPPSTVLLNISISLPAHVAVETAEHLAFGITIEEGKQPDQDRKIRQPAMPRLRLRDMELLLTQTEKHSSACSAAYHSNFPILPEALHLRDLPNLPPTPPSITQADEQSALRRGGYDREAIRACDRVVNLGTQATDHVERVRTTVIGPPPDEEEEEPEQGNKKKKEGKQKHKQKDKDKAAVAASGAEQSLQQQGAQQQSEPSSSTSRRRAPFSALRTLLPSTHSNSSPQHSQPTSPLPGQTTAVPNADPRVSSTLIAAASNPNDEPRASYIFHGEDGTGVNLSRGRVRMSVNLPLKRTQPGTDRLAIMPDYDSPFFRIRHRLKVKLSFDLLGREGEPTIRQILAMVVPVRFSESPPSGLRQSAPGGLSPSLGNEFAADPTRLAARRRRTGRRGGDADGAESPPSTSLTVPGVALSTGPSFDNVFLTLPAYTQLFNEDGTRLADEGEDLPVYRPRLVSGTKGAEDENSEHGGSDVAEHGSVHRNRRSSSGEEAASDSSQDEEARARPFTPSPPARIRDGEALVERLADDQGREGLVEVDDLDAAVNPMALEEEEDDDLLQPEGGDRSHDRAGSVGGDVTGPGGSGRVHPPMRSSSSRRILPVSTPGSASSPSVGSDADSDGGVGPRIGRSPVPSGGGGGGGGGGGRVNRKINRGGPDRERARLSADFTTLSVPLGRIGGATVNGASGPLPLRSSPLRGNFTPASPTANGPSSPSRATDHEPVSANTAGAGAEPVSPTTPYPHRPPLSSGKSARTIRSVSYAPVPAPPMSPSASSAAAAAADPTYGNDANAHGDDAAGDATRGRGGVDRTANKGKGKGKERTR